MKAIISSTILCLALLSAGLVYSQQLSEIQTTAAEKNPGLQAKYLEFEAALERVSQVNSLPDPNFGFGYFLSPVETRVGPQRAKFSLTQMFPWFGTLAAQEDAAAMKAQADYQEFIDERNKLYYKVAAAYFPLYELREWQAIDRQNIRILKSYKAIANSKFENGKGNLSDVLRVDIRLNDAIENLKIIENKETPLRAALNALINRELDESIAMPDTLLAESIPDNSRRDSLLANNPRLKEVELREQGAVASQETARKQGLPGFGLGVDYIIVDERKQADVHQNGQDALMPMLTMRIPIFRKKYNAAKKEAELMQEAYRLKKEDRANDLVAHYEMSTYELKKQLNLLQLYRQQAQKSQQTLNILLSAYANNEKDFEEVLRMQQKLLKYRKMEVTALVNYRVEKAQMDYLTAKSM